MIVSQERFEQVQAQLRQNASLAARNNTAHPYLLKSLVSCGLCRGACVGVTRGTHSYYLCHGKWHPIHTHQEERCRSRYIPVGQLDELVWQDLCHLLADPSNLAEALRRAQGGNWLPQEMQARREQHRKALTALTAQMERLTEAYLAGVVPMEEYRQRRQELEQRLIALDQQHRLVEAQTRQQLEVSGICEALTDFCQRVQVGLAEATFDEMRQLVELLIDRVIVRMDEVEIRYVIPTSPRSEHIRFCHLHTDYFRMLVVLLVSFPAVQEESGTPIRNQGLSPYEHHWIRIPYSAACSSRCCFTRSSRIAITPCSQAIYSRSYPTPRLTVR